MAKKRKPKQLGLFDAIPLPSTGEPHEWLQFEGRNWSCCRKCGVLRREANRPCVGIVAVTVKAEKAKP